MYDTGSGDNYLGIVDELQQDQDVLNVELNMGPIPIVQSRCDYENESVEKHGQIDGYEAMIYGYDWEKDEDIWFVRNDSDREGSPLVIRGECDGTCFKLKQSLNN